MHFLTHPIHTATVKKFCFTYFVICRDDEAKQSAYGNPYDG